MVTVMEQVGPKRAYRVSELKAQGGPGRARAFKLIRDGKLLAHKDGHNTIIFAENLARYFASLPAIEPKASSIVPNRDPEHGQGRGRRRQRT